jgi:hypothetical protein
MGDLPVRNKDLNDGSLKMFFFSPQEGRGTKLTITGIVKRNSVLGESKMGDLPPSILR